jgi:hypothetical protein
VQKKSAILFPFSRHFFTTFLRQWRISTYIYFLQYALLE